MHISRSSLFAALVTVFVAQSSTTFAQSVIYRETFGNNTAGNLALNNVNIGWNSLVAASTGANLVDGSSDLGATSGISTGTSTPTNLDNVNAGATLSQTNGNLFNVSTTQGLDYTNEFSIDQSAFTVTSVSWYANRNTGASGVPTQNLALQIGGTWYVTTPPGTSNVTSSFAQLTFNLSSVTWKPLTATAGSPFALGSTTTLPGGTITGFGVYYDMGANAITSRFDTFEITATSAVPEPSTYAAFAGFAALGLAAWRRRRSHAK